MVEMVLTGAWNWWHICWHARENVPYPAVMLEAPAVVLEAVAAAIPYSRSTDKFFGFYANSLSLVESLGQKV